ncbi:MAG: hypothetical protein HY445_03220 [Candidatus Niyogibacteria bacterium]|nr:hypothetical protein [Candidatus Niyogibacteria bacterium]
MNQPFKRYCYITATILGMFILIALAVRPIIESSLFGQITFLLPYFFWGAGFVGALGFILYLAIRMNLMTLGALNQVFTHEAVKKILRYAAMLVALVVLYKIILHFIPFTGKGVDFLARFYGIDMRIAIIIAAFIVMVGLLLLLGLCRVFELPEGFVTYGMSTVVTISILFMIFCGIGYLKQPNKFFNSLTGIPEVALTDEGRLVRNVKVKYAGKEKIISPKYDEVYGGKLETPTRVTIEPHVKDYGKVLTFKGLRLFFEKESSHFLKEMEEYDPVKSVQASSKKESPRIHITHPRTNDIYVTNPGEILDIQWEKENVSKGAQIFLHYREHPNGFWSEGIKINPKFNDFSWKVPKEFSGKTLYVRLSIPTEEKQKKELRRDWLAVSEILLRVR